MSVCNRDSLLGAYLDRRHIFVTGGTGFVGRSLLDKFQGIYGTGAEFNVSVLSRNPDAFLRSYPQYQNSEWLTLLRGDLESLSLEVSGYTDVIHAAADTHLIGNGARWIRQIVNGTEAVLEFAARNGAERFLLTSSGAVYGQQPADMSHLSELSASAPSTTSLKSTYGQAKRVAEQLCTVFCHEHGLDTVIARCFAFVGKHIPLDGPYAIGNFIRDALSGGDIRVKGDGTAIRSYLSGNDMADWLLTLLVRGQAGEAYNVGSDIPVSMAALADLVRQLIRPTANVVVEGTPDGNPPASYVPSIEKAKTLDLSVWSSLEESIIAAAGEITRVAA